MNNEGRILRAQELKSQTKYTHKRVDTYTTTTDFIQVHVLGTRKEIIKIHSPKSEIEKSNDKPSKLVTDHTKYICNIPKRMKAVDELEGMVYNKQELDLDEETVTLSVKYLERIIKQLR